MIFIDEKTVIAVQINHSVMPNVFQASCTMLVITIIPRFTCF